MLFVRCYATSKNFRGSFCFLRYMNEFVQRERDGGYEIVRMLKKLRLDIPSMKRNRISYFINGRYIEPFNTYLINARPLFIGLV